jgi:hypothetical protein
VQGPGPPGPPGPPVVVVTGAAVVTVVTGAAVVTVVVGPVVVEAVVADASPPSPTETPSKAFEVLPPPTPTAATAMTATRATIREYSTMDERSSVLEVGERIA